MIVFGCYFKTHHVGFAMHSLSNHDAHRLQCADVGNCVWVCLQERFRDPIQTRSAH
jgi:hypothetical protein